MTRSVTVLTNPAAGGGRAAQLGRCAVARLRERELNVTAIEGRTPGDALALLEKAVGTGTDAVVAVGGDGLVNLVLQVLAATDTPMGLIPAGTGNDLARALGLPRDDAARAADIVADNLTRTIDLGRIGERWFATVLSSGFDSLVTERARLLRWPRGPLRYNAAMVLQLASLRKLSYVIEMDDAELRLDATLVAVGNGSSYGGGMAICPSARLDDGLLDITVVRGVSRTRLVGLSPTLYRGTHVDLPEVDTYTSTRVTLRCEGIVAYADGERIAELPVTAYSVPQALRVFVARGSAPGAR
ncbi:diacylglycerol kinase [Rhodococcus sp. ARC_M12]|uniref:diacylglycerol kinase n=1 Tax=unclassified Rhodococcus (in: high G+C Gram-positive bacteria) TaxID=192944 RepID=UPI001FB4486C|nr:MULTISPECIES: diacylglycerol kinase [unclassified Rhodococcus (in: high G+C Gram-positive bacteria)]MCJ0893367.1 diacylglycerol kinase [Rhodococcus sp. ARC_M5]MCJ0976374.1 diacylglycerol kinase [Rhodococcus sp. ARC_M12]